MTFWSTSTGEDLSKQPTQAGEYEAPGGGNMDPIPDGSTVLASIKEAKWDRTKPEDGADAFVSLRWDVMEPESVKNRVVFQKLWVKDDDPKAKDPKKKRDNALKMFSAIDANCGGKLAAKGTEPSDDELLVALANKAMAITLKVWEMETSQGKIDGNWVCAVAQKGKELRLTEEPKADTSLGDDEAGIPF